MAREPIVLGGGTTLERSTAKPHSRHSSSMSRQFKGQRRYQQTACRISEASKCRPLKSSLDRRFSFAVVALRIVASLRTGATKLAAMPDEPSTPEICDRPNVTGDPTC